jgi:hypothetical protein
MTKEALRLALEALEMFCEHGAILRPIETRDAIKEALANEALDKMAENARELGLDYEPEQPKVRTGNCLRVGVCASEGHKIAPQRTWVGLTDEEIRLQWSEFWEAECHPWAIEFAQAIEAKLRSKNNG